MTFPFKWRIYYDDGTTFSNTDGPPHESPVWGAVGVSQPEFNIQLVGNGDHYIWRTDLQRWHEVGDSVLVDHITHFGHLIGCVRCGRWMPRNEDFKAMWKRLREDVDA